MQVSRGARKSKKLAKSRRSVVPYSPPELNAVLRIGMTLRYLKTSTVSANVYPNCLGKLIVATTDATSHAFVIYESILIRKVSAWSMGVVNNSAGGFDITTNTITLRFDDGAVSPYGQERRYTDTPTTGRGAHVSAKTKGLNATWLDSEAAQGTVGQRFLEVEGPQGMIVDVKCTIQVIVNRGSAGTNLLGPASTARLIYFNTLDNTTSAGNLVGTQVLKNINSTNNVTTSFI